MKDEEFLKDIVKRIRLGHEEAQKLDLVAQNTQETIQKIIALFELAAKQPLRETSGLVVRQQLLNKLHSEQQKAS